MDQLRALGLKRASCSVFASDNMAAESHFYAYHRYNEFAQGIRLVLRAPSHGLDAGPGWKAAGAVVRWFFERELDCLDVGYRRNQQPCPRDEVAIRFDGLC